MRTRNEHDDDDDDDLGVIPKHSASLSSYYYYDKAASIHTIRPEYGAWYGRVPFRSQKNGMTKTLCLALLPLQGGIHSYDTTRIHGAWYRLVPFRSQRKNQTTSLVCASTPR